MAEESCAMLLRGRCRRWSYLCWGWVHIGNGTFHPCILMESNLADIYDWMQAWLIVS